MNKIIAPLLLFVTIVICNFANAENKRPCSITLVVRNQRSTTLSVERIYEDKHIIVDSLEIKTKEDQEINSSIKIRTYTFNLSSEKPAGFYRLIMGKTLVAEVLNEAPQSIDIVVNSEDIFIETNFENPLESAKILDSEENKLWFKFMARKSQFTKAYELAQKELDYCFDSKSGTINCSREIKQYNNLQAQQNQFIDSLFAINPHLFSARVIHSFAIPYIDGQIWKSQRDSILKNKFFENINFADESLLNSSIFTDKIYSYLMLFAKPGLSKIEQENQFITAIGNIFESLRKPESNEPQNSRVFDFVIDYLIRGFEETDMRNVVSFIGENYSTYGCQSEKKSVTDRKLSYYKMKRGYKVPDFKMKDINGDPIQLSEFLKPVNIILFWSADCPHCLEMLPKIKAWHKDNHANNLEIFAISLDSDQLKWQKAVTELQMESWLNLSDSEGWDGQTALQYNVFKTPTFFILDDNRTILSKPQSVTEISNFYTRN